MLKSSWGNSEEWERCLHSSIRLCFVEMLDFFSCSSFVAFSKYPIISNHVWKGQHESIFSFFQWEHMHTMWDLVCKLLTWSNLAVCFGSNSYEPIMSQKVVQVHIELNNPSLLIHPFKKLNLLRQLVFRSNSLGSSQYQSAMILS